MVSMLKKRNSSVSKQEKTVPKIKFDNVKPFTDGLTSPVIKTFKEDHRAYNSPYVPGIESRLVKTAN